MKLLATSTSYIAPKNLVWRELHKKYDLKFSNYGNWANDLISANKNMTIIFVLFFEDLLNLDEANEHNHEKNLLGVLELIVLRLDKNNTPLICTILQVENLNFLNHTKSISSLKRLFFWFSLELEKIAKKYKNFYLIDLENEISWVGKSACIDQRNWYLAHCHLSNKGLSVLSGSVSRFLRKYTKANHKVLVLDCDNTLWGGIVGEDGMKNIVLGGDGIGKIYQDFQREIKKFSNKGILIAIASKNNEEDVMDVFRENNQMILKRSDISIFKINWREKHKNIQEMAKELGLGLDSFVFWDDSPVERDKVRLILPEVFTVEAPENIFNWPDLLKNLDCFSKEYYTNEDFFKKKQYERRAMFIKDKKIISDERSYLKSINLKPKLFKIDNSNINRAAQLCLKTNQFNLRTIRYSREELIDMKSSKEYIIFLTNLKDKYGDHGLVGLNCLKKINKDYIFIDTFLMSCRAMGRHLEAWMLLQIIAQSKRLGIKYVLGEYVETNKNIIVKNFYNKYGFKKIRIDKINTNLKGALFGSDLFILSTTTNKIPHGDIYE